MKTARPASGLAGDKVISMTLSVAHSVPDEIKHPIIPGTRYLLVQHALTEVSMHQLIPGLGSFDTIKGV